MSRYDEASPEARNLLDGFDEVDLAELGVQQQARNRSLQQQLVQAQTELEQLRAHARQLAQNENEIRELLSTVGISPSPEAWDLGVAVLLILDGP